MIPPPSPPVGLTALIETWRESLARFDAGSFHLSIDEAGMLSLCADELEAAVREAAAPRELVFGGDEGWYRAFKAKEAEVDTLRGVRDRLRSELDACRADREAAAPLDEPHLCPKHGGDYVICDKCKVERDAAALSYQSGDNGPMTICPACVVADPRLRLCVLHQEAAALTLHPETGDELHTGDDALLDALTSIRAALDELVEGEHGPLNEGQGEALTYVYHDLAKADELRIAQLRLEAGSPALLDERVRKILEAIAAADSDDTIGSIKVDIPIGDYPRQWLQPAVERLLAVDPPVLLLPSQKDEDVARREPHALTDRREDSRPQPKGSER